MVAPLAEMTVAHWAGWWEPGSVGKTGNLKAVARAGGLADKWAERSAMPMVDAMAVTSAPQ